MKTNLLLTPEGVRDIYHGECARKHAVEDKIRRMFHLYGYEEIETPVFEFFDIFNKERGSVPSEEMFKFFDRDNHTLVLRPDMTPPIARYVSRYFSEEIKALRLCYLERTFLNAHHYQGRLTQSTQTGAELIGDDSADADAEMVAMMIESLLGAGLGEFQVELGQVDFFRGLCEEAGMGEDAVESLRDLIENKNYFGIEELVSSLYIPDRLRGLFLRLPEMFGDLDQVAEAKALTDNPRAQAALHRLEKIHKILALYGLTDYVSYDLGMLSKYRYYTGVIFKAYTHGTGDYLVNGGRYDKLLVQFGNDKPAVGFAIVIDRLLTALERQGIDVPVELVDTLVLYDPPARARAIEIARNIRKGGAAAVLTRRKDGQTKEDYLAFALAHGIGKVMVLGENGDIAEIRA
ncbi:MAG: ATP phosphoribosyltransferase regulatory subunit [Lachnospiraceae bacterium]|jgi:ATP phosphoribosyltransferase regulatory subunit|nr:ATP phosphoribosyltransferase regulatory subunit [Lachnospiraceae bacterium]